LGNYFYQVIIIFQPKVIEIKEIEEYKEKEKVICEIFFEGNKKTTKNKKYIWKEIYVLYFNKLIKKVK
jgi:hypothetical protein